MSVLSCAGSCVSLATCPSDHLNMYGGTSVFVWHGCFLLLFFFLIIWFADDFLSSKLCSVFTSSAEKNWKKPPVWFFHLISGIIACSPKIFLKLCLKGSADCKAYPIIQDFINNKPPGLLRQDLKFLFYWHALYMGTKALGLNTICFS